MKYIVGRVCVEEQRIWHGLTTNYTTSLRSNVDQGINFTFGIKNKKIYYTNWGKFFLSLFYSWRLYVVLFVGAWCAVWLHFSLQKKKYFIGL